VNKHRIRYHQHKSNARTHGTEFLLTFEEWFEIWEKSGHLHERGRCRGQYQMARKGDKGPYAIGNVKIITVTENRLEVVLTDASRRKRSKLMRGNTRKLGKIESLETRKKKSLAKLGNKYTLGYKHSKATKKKWSQIRSQWWKDRKCQA
jgi:hypothetical protein